MNDSAIEARILLAGALELDPANVADDAAMGTVETWDSLAHMRLILAIEAALGRELDPDALFEIASLGDVAALLESANNDSAES